METHMKLVSLLSMLMGAGIFWALGWYSALLFTARKRVAAVSAAPLRPPVPFQWYSLDGVGKVQVDGVFGDNVHYVNVRGDHGDCQLDNWYANNPVLHNAAPL